MTNTGLTAAQTDRACGVLVGAACGDALGAGYEFGTAALPGPNRRVGMIGGGLGGFAPGEWTDDTSQTYAVAAAAATGADLRTPGALDHIARGLADWFAGGPPDVGVQTRHVLATAGAEATAETMTRVAAALHARTGRASGNGSLMRTSAVALAHLGDPVALVEAAMGVSALTHADPRAQQACALWCLAIRHAVLTGQIPNLTDCIRPLPQESHDFWTARADEAERREPESFEHNGYVVTALQAAWSAITHTPVPANAPSRGTFGCHHLTDALERAVRIGGDTDTVASIAGALLGARWGASAVPARWRAILHGWPGRTATDLTDMALLTVNGGRPDSLGWPGCLGIDYRHWNGHDALAVHPHDPQVYLSGASTLTDVPQKVTAVVSLCRVGREQLPTRLRGKHVQFRILDTTASDNPNLEHVIDDAARTILRWRAQGETVLLHCVAAHSRTPTVAARYAVLLGRPLDSALHDVCAVLPDADPNPVLVAALHRLGNIGVAEDSRGTCKEGRK
ncbi:ADP-ribosylglycohydrolase family protein [Knoellia sp. CPCC 206435]|uniref:ADP-ribosylglycohydrolase family protein n=1 Tax=Knoellia terrae TaxID=3404797 RepID=UPI003B42B3CE